MNNAFTAGNSVYTKQKLDLKDLGEHFHFDWVKMGLHRNCTIYVSIDIEQKSSGQPKEDIIFESALLINIVNNAIMHSIKLAMNSDPQ